MGCITGRSVLFIPSVLTTPCLVSAYTDIQTHKFTYLPFFVEMKEDGQSNETYKKPTKVMTSKTMTKCKQQTTCFWSLVNLNKYPDEQSGTCNLLTLPDRLAEWPWQDYLLYMWPCVLQYAAAVL